MAIEHAQQALGLIKITVAWALVLELFTGKLMEKAYLPKHRPNAPHLKHQPLQGVVALDWVGRKQLPGFLGQINQNCARLPKPHWLAVGAVRVNDGWDFIVGV